MSNKKWFQIILGVIVLGFLLWLALYATQTKREILVSSTEEEQIDIIQEVSFFVDADGKSIIKNGDVFLSITDPRIFSWFKQSAGLCDESNIGNTEARKDFCSNEAAFAEKTNFVFAESSPDFQTVVFVVETEELTPDRVVGAITQDGAFSMLTRYYLGNEFLGFSPDGTYFAVKDSCFEAKCSITVYQTNTLSVVEKVNDTPGDERSHSAVFVSWNSNKTLSYKLGEETKELVID